MSLIQIKTIYMKNFSQKSQLPYVNRKGGSPGDKDTLRASGEGILTDQSLVLVAGVL